MKKRNIIIAVVALLVLAGVIFTCTRKKAEMKIGFETARIAPVDISNSVTATGTLEAVTTVDVGTQVSGIVKKLYVDFNSVVKKGQVIAILDRTNCLSSPIWLRRIFSLIA